MTIVHRNLSKTLLLLFHTQSTGQSLSFNLDLFKKQPFSSNWIFGVPESSSGLVNDHKLIGHSIMFTLVFGSEFFTRNDVCFGLLSSCKTKWRPRPTFAAGSSFISSDQRMHFQYAWSLSRLSLAHFSLTLRRLFYRSGVFQCRILVTVELANKFPSVLAVVLGSLNTSLIGFLSRNISLSTSASLLLCCVALFELPDDTFHSSSWHLETQW